MCTPQIQLARDLVKGEDKPFAKFAGNTAKTLASPATAMLTAANRGKA